MEHKRAGWDDNGLQIIPPCVAVRRGPKVPVSRDFEIVAVLVLCVLSGTGIGHSVATGGLQPSRRTALFGVFPHDL